MNYTQQNLNDDLRFISSYIAMESTTLAQSKKHLKSILPPHKLNHLTNSWVGRYDDDNKVGDFGSFYTNIEHKTQALFLLNWGLEIPDLENYLKEINSGPIASISTTPPILLERLHFLLVFFNNNGINSVVDGYSLIDLPKERFGNSYNWGNYILSLNKLEQFKLLSHISAYCFNGIKDSEENRAFFKTAKPI